MSGLDEGQGDPEESGCCARPSQGLPGVCGCCVSLLRPGSGEVEKEAPGPRVGGLTYTAAGSAQL